MISLVMKREGFTKDFSALLGRTKNPVGMLKVAGREVANQLKTWFRRKDREEPNKLSDRRSHFWLAVSRTVGNPVQTGPTAISVTVAHPAIAQKVFGGTIRAKIASALTIPVEERAYGRTAATFEKETGLKLVLIKNGKGNFRKAVLAAVEDGKLTVEYLLTPSVHQDADPTALPPKSDLEAAILKRANSFLQNEQAAGGAS